MAFMINEIKNTQKAHTVKLGAQTHALSFYEGLGFTACSDEYLDAGIPHRDMQLIFNENN
jgi:predicted GNAT family N-acyltransferase